MSTRELAKKFADRLPESAHAIATQQAIVELKPVSPEEYFLRKRHTLARPVLDQVGLAVARRRADAAVRGWPICRTIS